jgi:hypothetical protein
MIVIVLIAAPLALTSIEFFVVNEATDGKARRNSGAENLVLERPAHEDGVAVSR